MSIETIANTVDSVASAFSVEEPDQTVVALRAIEEFARTHRATIDRVEVSYRKVAGGFSVEFTGHLIPKPLPNGSKACLGYFIPIVSEGLAQ